jgi:hypothetical protein
MRRKFIYFIFFGVLSLIGCVSPFAQPFISIGVENRSMDRFENMRCFFGKFGAELGNVGPNGKSFYGGFGHPITKEVELHWGSGAQHEFIRLGIPTNYKKGMSGTFRFRISPGEKIDLTFEEKK